ncbi:MAG TPA: nitroreductase/quinone reductase family protein [Thermomicrobiales bacterium]|nr:nitroreductase/quinone reductase family protein [Thermomicrobiales bacterium]
MATQGKPVPATWLQKAANRVVNFLVDKLGLNLKGAMVLEVRGRTSGQPHRVPVNPVTVDGTMYLFAPRGETAWVKNIRVSREAILHRGRKATQFGAEEVLDDAKLPILRAYLDRWHWQVSSQVGVPKDATDDQLRQIAPNHPVFRLLQAQAFVKPAESA